MRIIIKLCITATAVMIVWLTATADTDAPYLGFFFVSLLLLLAVQIALLDMLSTPAKAEDNRIDDGLHPWWQGIRCDDCGELLTGPPVYNSQLEAVHPRCPLP